METDPNRRGRPGIPRYLNPKYELQNIRFGYGYAHFKVVIESLEVHIAQAGFTCGKCHKSKPNGSFYMGDNKLCINCMKFQFDDVKKYIDGLQDILKFHEEVVEENKKRMENTDVALKI